MPTTGAPSPAPDARARILLVDDDPMITQLITDMLSLDGYDVDNAPNGVAALEKVQGRRYDLILTGTSGTSEAHRVVQETGLPLLGKSFNVAELLELVRKVLGAS